MDFDDVLEGAQPHCPECGVMMRDDEGGWACPECRRFESNMHGPLPGPFNGPSIHGG